MLMSKLLGERFKEKPTDAFLDSHIFLVRGGYIRQVSGGIFTLLTPAKKITQKIEAIIRREMDAVGGQEVLFPVVLPAELWRESGRFDSVGSELLRFQDRAGRDMLLGMTHEEAAVHLARGEAKSYLRYPFMIYQIQTKFRDEPRARGGLIRVREFTMKDAYSFHTSQEDLEVYYEQVYKAYERIFKAAGLTDVISVQSDNGMMGGKMAHEFMFLSDGGEDSLALCSHCDYRANLEVAVSRIAKVSTQEQAREEVHTPGIQDIDSLAAFLNVSPAQTMKATVFSAGDTPVVVFVRGDRQVSETKLKKHLQAEVQPLTDAEVPGLCFGFIGAYGLEAPGVKVVCDVSLLGENCLVGGANRTDYHVKGISVSRDLGLRDSDFVDVSKAEDGDACPECGKPLSIRRGIEVGNIFQLGTKYTQSMQMTYADADGKLQTPIMGCYGIGVGRLLACVVEQHHDNYGPIWPKAIAPWQVHILMLNQSAEGVQETGLALYEALSQQYEVLLDDRNAAAGVQFAEADLLGAPVRIIVSQKGLANGEVEIATRDKSFQRKVPKEEAQALVAELLAQ